MATTVEQLAAEAMDLPAPSRARLAELLLDSLDEEALEPLQSLWLAEAKRRREDVRGGKPQVIPGDRAIQRLRDDLHR